MKQGYDFISTELILSLLTYFWMPNRAIVLFPNQDTIFLLPTCVNLIYVMKSKGHTCALLVFIATLFSIFLTRLNFHLIHTGTDGLRKPAIAWICVAVGIVLVAAAIASILAYIQKGTPVLYHIEEEGTVTYIQIYDESAMETDPSGTEMMSNSIYSSSTWQKVWTYIHTYR